MAGFCFIRAKLFVSKQLKTARNPEGLGDLQMLVQVRNVGGLIHTHMESLSVGEMRVRTSFNPSENGTVDQIKQKTAELINLCEELKGDGSSVISGETMRLISLAQTSFEEAAMWGVKAATA